MHFLFLCWPSTLKLWSLQIHNCNFAIVINRNINIWYAGYLICDPVKELVDHQAEDHWSKGLPNAECWVYRYIPVPYQRTTSKITFLWGFFVLVFWFFGIVFFKTGFLCIALAVLNSEICLPLPPECWDYRYATPLPGSFLSIKREMALYLSILL